MHRNPKIMLALAMVIVVGLQLATIGNSFFWDTVQLGSAHGTFFYDNGFGSWLLPDGVDSGHIPAFGAYIALMWKIFGRTLPVSHLAMVPFAIGAVWQLYGLCKKFIPYEYAGWALLLIVLDPTLLSQFTLVSPDVPLVFFFALTLNAVLDNKKWLLALGAVLLFLTSMRGMMCVVCLLMLDLYVNFSLKDRRQLLPDLIRRSVLYWPSVVVFVVFNSYHYANKGWIGYHADSPWADCFARVDWKGFIFNIAIYGWRLLDFGRIGIWLAFVFLLIRFGKHLFAARQTRTLALFTITLMLLLPANMLWAKNLLAHRYLLPVFLVFSLLVAALLFQKQVGRGTRLTLSAFWFVVLVSGNLWIYPPKIAMGWDSTLAHLPYYALRSDAIAYLEKQKIGPEQVHSFFPNDAARDLQELNGKAGRFENFDAQSPYVFYSNVYNIDDTVYDRLFVGYRVIKKFENRGIYILIMKKNTGLR